MGGVVITNNTGKTVEVDARYGDDLMLDSGEKYSNLVPKDTLNNGQSKWYDCGGSWWGDNDVHVRIWYGSSKNQGKYTSEERWEVMLHEIGSFRCSRECRLTPGNGCDLYVDGSFQSTIKPSKLRAIHGKRRVCLFYSTPKSCTGTARQQYAASVADKVSGLRDFGLEVDIPTEYPGKQRAKIFNSYEGFVIFMDNNFNTKHVESLKRALFDRHSLEWEDDMSGVMSEIEYVLESGKGVLFLHDNKRRALDARGSGASNVTSLNTLQSEGNVDFLHWSAVRESTARIPNVLKPINM